MNLTHPKEDFEEASELAKKVEDNWRIFKLSDDIKEEFISSWSELHGHRGECIDGLTRLYTSESRFEHISDVDLTKAILTGRLRSNLHNFKAAAERIFVEDDVFRIFNQNYTSKQNIRAPFPPWWSALDAAIDSDMQLDSEEKELLKIFLTNADEFCGIKGIARTQGDFAIPALCNSISMRIDRFGIVDDIAKATSSDVYIRAKSLVEGIPIPGSSGAFDIARFIDSLKKTNFCFKETLPLRFVSALQTKPFLILSGLSGSGKTKIAEAFAMWIAGGQGHAEAFQTGDQINGPRATYTVEGVDRLGVLINQGESDTLTLLPFKLIKIWSDTIEEHGFGPETGSQVIEEQVRAGGIEYSPTLNSFHSPLKALALKYIDFKKSQATLTGSNQYCMISVGADWTNREPLLGFPNALEPGTYVKPDSGALDLVIRAEKDPSRPYFMILDEMNMSHVERYFADFLSAMESTDRTISLHPDTDLWKDSDVPATLKLPENLFIIGTVNIDETTYMFSPKVLDRANVIEFRVSHDEMESFLGEEKDVDLNALRGKGASMGESFVAKAKERGVSANDFGTTLLPFFDKLQEMGFEFGYRTAAEMSRFVAIYTDMVDADEAQKGHIVDAAIIQKLLPKVHGSRNKIEKVLKALGALCLENPFDEPFQVNDEKEDMHPVKYPLSYEKLKRMHTRVISDGFTSFAEA